MKRIWLGILVVLIFGTAFDSLVPSNTWLGNLLGDTGLGLFIIMATGAFVAREKFLLPAIAITTIMWTFTVFAAFQIAATVEPTTWVDVASKNIGGLIVYLIAAGLGASLGMRLSDWTSLSQVPEQE